MNGLPVVLNLNVKCLPFIYLFFLYQFISNEHLNKYNNDPWPLVLFPKKEMDITLHNCYLDVFLFSFDLNESFT